MASRVDVLFNRQVIAEGIAMTSGQITYDRNAARLARLSLTVADPLRIPSTADDILTPFGYELLAWRGVQLPTGAELVPLGVFPIQSSGVDGVTLLSSITAEDRSRLVSDARFEDDYQIAAGTNYATAIENMIAAGVAGLTFLFPSTSFTTPLLTFAAQEDRWEKAQNMAKSIGQELLFDGLGRCVMRPEPTFAGTPVASIAEGVNMTEANVELDRAGAYNRVIASSSNASNGAVFRGVATDDNPSSPTYYLGPFGKKPRFFSSEFLASDVQASAAAAAILAANIGVARSVDFAAIPDPRLECSDVVQITRTPLGIDELHIIDTLSIGLGADSTMSGTSRTQQVAS
jgi:hypothetical protein